MACLETVCSQPRCPFQIFTNKHQTACPICGSPVKEFFDDDISTGEDIDDI